MLKFFKDNREVAILASVILGMFGMAASIGHSFAGKF